MYDKRQAKGPVSMLMKARSMCTHSKEYTGEHVVTDIYGLTKRSVDLMTQIDSIPHGPSWGRWSLEDEKFALLACLVWPSAETLRSASESTTQR